MIEKRCKKGLKKRREKKQHRTPEAAAVCFKKLVFLLHIPILGRFKNDQREVKSWI